MTPIDPALLAVAATGLPDPPPLSRDGWEAHLDAVIENGLAGLFSSAAAAGLVDIDADMAARLQGQLEAEAVRAVQLEGELLRLAAALEDLGAAILKGAVLAHGAYPDLVLRPFTDLDVLVPGARMSEAVEAFATYGYERTRPEPAPGYDARVAKAVTLAHPGGVVIDLHRTLAAGNVGEGIDVEELLADRRAVVVGSLAVPAPSWEAHLIECALHAVVGDGLRRPLSLRDVAEIVRHPALDSEVAVELAVRWKVSGPVGRALRAARDDLGMPLPDALAALAGRADDAAPASSSVRSARSRLDELRRGDLARRATVARSLVAPSAEFLRWVHGPAPLARLYGRRWRSLYERAREGYRDDGSSHAPDAVADPPTGALGVHHSSHDVSDAVADPPTGALGVHHSSHDVSDAAPRPLPAPVGPPSRTLPSRSGAATTGPNGTNGANWSAVATPAGGRQEAWTRARPQRQGTVNGNGRSPHGTRNGARGGRGGDDGEEDGGGPAADPDRPPTTTPSSPAPHGLALGLGGAALLALTVAAARLGVTGAGVVLVPLAGLLFAGAMARRIARVRPDEAWVGRWLVLGVVAKLTASYLRYFVLVNDYDGVGDAAGYDRFGRRFAAAWLGTRSSAPDLPDLRNTNFVRWFTGVVYYLFGQNMIAGFFVFGLLALVGSYLWYRATVDAVPRIDKRIYLALVLFAPSIAFWPASIGKEALMQLGIGVVALGTAYLLRHRLLAATALSAAGGWLLWVVRPHLLALVALAAGVAYVGGRVGGNRAGGNLLRRPVGLLAVVLLAAFTIGQASDFLGIEDLSVSSIEAELDEQTERSSQGGSEFDNGDNSLNPLRLPHGAITVLLRPFPWETDTNVQLLASLESLVLTVFIVSRLRSVRTSLFRARSTPFLLYCWALTALYAITFSSFANFGLLVRQRSLVLPALFVLLAVRAVPRPGPRRPGRSPARPARPAEADMTETPGKPEVAGGLRGGG